MQKLSNSKSDKQFSQNIYNEWDQMLDNIEEIKQKQQLLHPVLKKKQVTPPDKSFYNPREPIQLKKFNSTNIIATQQSIPTIPHEESQISSQVNIQQKDTEFPENLKQLTFDEVSKRFEKDKINLTNLTLTKYEKLCEQKPKLIQALPLSLQKNLSLPFISFDNINKLSQNVLIQNLEKSFMTTKGRWNNAGEKLFPKTSRKIDEKMFEYQSQTSSFRMITDKAQYSEKDILKFQLDHNQYQIYQMNKQLNSNQEKQLKKIVSSGQLNSNNNNRLHNILINNIKQLPSNIYNDKRDKQHEQMQQQLYQNQIQQQNQQQLPEQPERPLKLYKKQIYKNLKKKQINLNDTQSSVNTSVDEILQPQTYEVFWYETDQQTTWRPDAREGFGLINLGGNAYIYGGLSVEPLKDLCRYDIQKNKWVKINIQGEVADFGSFGHSVNYYKNKMIIFGGEYKYDKQTKRRECLNDIRTINLVIENQNNTNSGQPNQLSYQMNNVRAQGEYIFARRNHASCIIGKYLIVHGGINSHGAYLQDLWTLDLTIYNWQQGVFAQEQQEQQDNFTYQKGIAFHQATTIIHPERKKVDLYKNFEEESKKFSKLIKHEGVYFYGGINQRDKINHKLYILKVDNRFLTWVIPECQGTPPPARYQHSQDACLKLGIFVIYGGRNDELSQTGYFDEIWILKLNNLNWIQPQVQGIPKPPRANHKSWIQNSKMYIFGGYNQDGFLSSDVLSLELNNNLVAEIKKHEALLSVNNKNKNQTSTITDNINEKSQNYGNRNALRQSTDIAYNQRQITNIAYNQIQNNKQNKNDSIKFDKKRSEVLEEYGQNEIESSTTLKSKKQESKEFKIMESQKLSQKMIENAMTQREEAYKEKVQNQRQSFAQKKSYLPLPHISQTNFITNQTLSLSQSSLEQSYNKMKMQSLDDDISSLVKQEHETYQHWADINQQKQDMEISKRADISPNLYHKSKHNLKGEHSKILKQYNKNLKGQSSPQATNKILISDENEIYYNKNSSNKK